MVYHMQSYPKIVLVGLGPFSKRNYFELFKRHQFYPEFIIDLESKRSELTRFLDCNSLQIPFYLIPEEYRDCGILPDHQKQKIALLLKKHGITHAIVATEPKAHYAYLDFFIENGIHVQVEKPLTAPEFASISMNAAEKIEQDYESLLQKIEESPTPNLRVELQCQRRYHPVYQFIQEQIESFVREFDVPLTYCDIYHCDGMWNMPNEFLERENHPYKYGYGKLLHSGYHFIDLLGILLKSSFKYSSKTPNCAEYYGTGFSPLDSLGAVNQKDYERFFGHRQYDEIFEDPYAFGFSRFGELDFFSILQLFQGDRKISVCNLNLLQTGFCRRKSSVLPEDTYKNNGRVRHERLNLQFGPLLNIQVHSYLSQRSNEINIEDPISAGNELHFDVMIFRNSDLIGGKPFDIYHSSDFSSSKNGFNEMSREGCFLNFISNERSLSDLRDHKLSIQLLSKSLKLLCRDHANQIPIEKFELHSLCERALAV